MDVNSLKYAKSHEWVAFDGKTATIGITDFAVHQLTDLVHIELPKVGRTIREGETFGEVESVKAVSDLYAPVDGRNRRGQRGDCRRSRLALRRSVWQRLDGEDHGGRSRPRLRACSIAKPTSALRGRGKSRVTYLFNTPDQQRDMLQTIGAASVEELFEQIPPAIRLNRPLELPLPRARWNSRGSCVVSRHSELRLRRPRPASWGGGVYDHFIPAAVDEIAGRGEFYTAYTPYQAEASQGSLQAFFEYPVARFASLTGMDVCQRQPLRRRQPPSAKRPSWRCASPIGTRRSCRSGPFIPNTAKCCALTSPTRSASWSSFPRRDGTADPAKVKAAVDDRTACVVFQHPNFFGCLEEPEELTRVARDSRRAFVVSFDPISLGLLRRPGEYGADIAVAEGQPLGIPMQYGGPFLGVLTCRNNTFARCRDGWSVTPPIGRGIPAIRSRSRPANNTFAAKRRPATSAPTRACWRCGRRSICRIAGTRGSARSRRVVLP